MKDKLLIKILDDGSIRIETGSFSPASHRQADDLVRDIVRAMGGEEKIEHKHGHGVHTHEVHEHEHN